MNNNSPDKETAPFPFLNYTTVPQSYKDYYNSLSTKNEKIIEGSRLIIQPKFRTLRTSKFLIESAIVQYILICLRMKHAIISCFEDHATFYQHYGFKQIATGEGYDVYGLNGSPLFLSLSLSFVPQKNRSKLLQMAEEFKTTNKIIKTI